MLYKLQLFSLSTSKYSCNKPTLVCSTYVEDQVNFVTWQWLIMLATPFTERAGHAATIKLSPWQTAAVDNEIHALCELDL